MSFKSWNRADLEFPGFGTSLWFEHLRLGSINSIATRHRECWVGVCLCSSGEELALLRRFYNLPDECVVEFIIRHDDPLRDYFRFTASVLTIAETPKWVEIVLCPLPPKQRNLMTFLREDGAITYCGEPVAWIDRKRAQEILKSANDHPRELTLKDLVGD